MTPEEAGEKLAQEFLLGFHDNLHHDIMTALRLGNAMAYRIANAIRIAKAEQREADAKLADEFCGQAGEFWTAKHLAKAIREQK